MTLRNAPLSKPTSHPSLGAHGLAAHCARYGGTVLLLVLAVAVCGTASIASIAFIASVASADGHASEAAAAIDPATATTTAPAAEVNSPVQAIDAFHAGLIEIMKNAEALGINGRIDKLAPLMAQTFDLEFMASKTVGRHWSKLSTEDRARWSEIFARFTTANYAGRFKGFTGEKFVTLGVEDAARGTQLVLTKIVVPSEEDVQINYRVLERDGQWRVIDVYLNGTVSELALRRSEYSTALKRDGFEQLVASIETKIADLKSESQVDG